MQTNFIDMTSETLEVNANIFNKIFDFNVEIAKKLSKQVSDQTEKMLGATTFNDVVAVQTEWFGSLVDQTKVATEAMYEFSTEANESYGALWKKYAAAATVAPVVVPARKKAS